MITVKQLKTLLKNLPDDALAYAYEGERCGIVIGKDGKFWFIEANELKMNADKIYTEGFDKK